MSVKIPAFLNGVLTPVDKIDVHRSGLRHPAVSVFVLQDGAVLLQRRALSKYHTPGLWANTCCTHPAWDEDAAACAVRRLDEELGITDLTPVFRDRVEYRADVGGGLIEHELVDIFCAEAGHDLSISPDPEEVMDTRWVMLRDLPAMIARDPEVYTPWLRIYMADHATRIFGTDGQTATTA